jgi:hypothetical protein
MGVLRHPAGTAVATEPEDTVTHPNTLASKDGTEQMDAPTIEAPPELRLDASRIDTVVITVASAKNPRRVEMTRGANRAFIERSSTDV